MRLPYRVEDFCATVDEIIYQEAGRVSSHRRILLAHPPVPEQPYEDYLFPIQAPNEGDGEEAEAADLDVLQVCRSGCGHIAKVLEDAANHTIVLVSRRLRTHAKKLVYRRLSESALRTNA